VGLENASITLLENKALKLVEHRGHVVCLGMPSITLSWDSVDAEEYFVKMLGFESVDFWDYSDFQGAQTHIDLNCPIPHSLYEIADLLIDPGTIEHCFNIGQAFANIGNALKPGGVVFHVNPINWIDHGFWNLCPCAYYDAYQENGYADVAVYLRAFDGPPALVLDTPKSKALSETVRQVLNAYAKKVSSEPFAVPMQRRYSQALWKGNDDS
jgi:hypothetical protein